VFWTAQFARRALYLSDYALLGRIAALAKVLMRCCIQPYTLQYRVGPNLSRCRLERGLVENRRGSPPLNSKLLEGDAWACSDLSAMDLFNALSVICSAAAAAVELAMNYELAVIWTRAEAMRSFVLCLATKAKSV